MFPVSHHRFLELAVFRFEDVCVDIQEDMAGFLRTAALEKKAGIEATFRWLRRRQISICLLTDFNREDFFLLLDRLGWQIAEDELVQLAIVEQQRKPNPIRLACEAVGLTTSLQALAVVDSPRLLHCATAAGAHLVYGVTNGRSAYRELAAEPFRALLDSAIQLPDHLLRNLPSDHLHPRLSPQDRSTPPRLWYPSLG